MSGSSASAPDLLRQADAALTGNRLTDAEQIARELLRRNPADLAPLQLLAETALRAGNTVEGERLLRQILATAPGNTSAGQRYATLLWRQDRFAEALAQTDALLRSEPRNPQHRDLKASILAEAGQADDAIATYESLLHDHPEQPYVWVRYANALRMIGRSEESIAAYHKAAALKPDLGEAWYSLANLKTFRFSSPEIETMQRHVKNRALGRDSCAAMHFALGKALGDEARFSESFEHYLAGNALWRSGLAYNAEVTNALVAQCRELFTAGFFAGRANTGNPSTAPIFILGMPRAGSTLIEQILASHSAVEGLGELPEVMAMAARLDRLSPARYPAAICELNAAELKGLGTLYLESTQARRRQDKPRFTDKMPNNFLHIGLIRLMLPNAKIIDARRETMACCFSNFSHHFARGQEFTYDLSELWRFYADYAGLMDHYERVLPGTVHRVSYEMLIDNPEAEVRALLDYLGLPFEAGCLRHFETQRPVTSASSEQVRMPLYRDAMEYWRNYEPWLGPLKAALTKEIVQ